MRAASHQGGLSSVVFFVDRCLGQEKVTKALAAAGARVECHDDHFDQAALDADWLTVIGKRGWVALSKDNKVRYRDTERAAVLSAKVAYFIFRGHGMRGDDIAAVIVKALPQILLVLHKNKRPFIATISKSGEVKVLDDCQSTSSSHRLHRSTHAGP